MDRSGTGSRTMGDTSVAPWPTLVRGTQARQRQPGPVVGRPGGTARIRIPHHGRGRAAEQNQDDGNDCHPQQYHRYFSSHPRPLHIERYALADNYFRVASILYTPGYRRESTRGFCGVTARRLARFGIRLVTHNVDRTAAGGADVDALMRIRRTISPNGWSGGMSIPRSLLRRGNSAVAPDGRNRLARRAGRRTAAPDAMESDRAQGGRRRREPGRHRTTALWHALGWDVLLDGVAGDDPRDIPALVGFARWPSERARCLSSCPVGYVRCSMSTTRSRSKIVGQAAIEHRADSAAGV